MLQDNLSHKALSARDADGINAAMRRLSAAEGERMSNEDSDAVAEFIRSKGITRCPTACVSPTQALVGDADRAALEQHAATRDRLFRARAATNWGRLLHPKPR